MPVNQTVDVRFPDPTGIVQVTGSLEMAREAPKPDPEEIKRLAAEKAKLGLSDE